jgi:signal transduction histidine kinase
MTGTPILKEEKKVTRQVSKGLSVKNKNKMCSILGFLLYLKESGKMDETEAKRLMEELPLYSISRIQTEFLEQDAFDLKKVEVELWKPMVVENKLIKKTEKKEKKEKPKKEKKEKPKKEEDATEEKETETKKRGRKAKKQIIEFNSNPGDVEESESSADQLEELLNDMLETSEEEVQEQEQVKVEVDESDLDAVLRELEEDGELEEENMIVPVVVPPPPARGKKEKVKKDKKTPKEEEDKPKEEEKPKEEDKPKEEEKKVTKKEPANKKKVKISI